MLRDCIRTDQAFGDIKCPRRPRYMSVQDGLQGLDKSEFEQKHNSKQWGRVKMNLQAIKLLSECFTYLKRHTASLSRSSTQQHATSQQALYFFAVLSILPGLVGVTPDEQMRTTIRD